MKIVHSHHHGVRHPKAHIEEKKEEPKKDDPWGTGFSEDNWTFGNPKSIPDFGVIARKFDKSKKHEW